MPILLGLLLFAVFAGLVVWNILRFLRRIRIQMGGFQVALPGTEMQIRQVEAVDVTASGVPLYPGATPWTARGGGTLQVDAVGPQGEMHHTMSYFWTKDSLQQAGAFYRSGLGGWVWIDDPEEEGVAAALQSSDGRRITLHNQRGGTGICIHLLAKRLPGSSV